MSSVRGGGRRSDGSPGIVGHEDAFTAWHYYEKKGEADELVDRGPRRAPASHRGRSVVLRGRGRGRVPQVGDVQQASPTGTVRRALRTTAADAGDEVGEEFRGGQGEGDGRRDPARSPATGRPCRAARGTRRAAGRRTCRWLSDGSRRSWVHAPGERPKPVRGAAGGGMMPPPGPSGLIRGSGLWRSGRPVAERSASSSAGAAVAAGALSVAGASAAAPSAAGAVAGRSRRPWSEPLRVGAVSGAGAAGVGGATMVAVIFAVGAEGAAGAGRWSRATGPGRRSTRRR